jgi:hypothetical protein
LSENYSLDSSEDELCIESDDSWDFSEEDGDLDTWRNDEGEHADDDSFQGMLFSLVNPFSTSENFSESSSESIPSDDLEDFSPMDELRDMTSSSHSERPVHRRSVNVQGMNQTHCEHLVNFSGLHLKTQKARKSRSRPTRIVRTAGPQLSKKLENISQQKCCSNMYASLFPILINF